MRNICDRAFLSSAVLLLALGLTPALAARPGDLITYLPFSTIAPQDIAQDEDGSFWIAALLDNRIYHFDGRLRTEIGSFAYPIANSYPTGVAFNTLDHTLFLADVLSSRIVEVERDGTPTGRELRPAFLSPPERPITPSLRGMAFDHTGRGGLGSLLVVEGTSSLIYELSLEGEIIGTFIHPDDGDGFPGKGASGAASDVDVIYDPARTRVIGYYVTGGRSRVSDIRRLEADGSYRGVTLSLDDGGGDVSGILRIPFELTEGGEKVDAFVCTVQSNARFAILEGGEPDFREVIHFECGLEGNEVHASWSMFQDYDSIEILRGCDVLATLPGNATEWRQALPSDRVYSLSLRATRGPLSTSPPPCTVVTGVGAVLELTEVGSMLPVDIAATENGLILVTEARERKILQFAPDLTPLDPIELGDEVATLEEVITGIAYAPGVLPRLYVFNATTSKVAVLDDLGALIETIEARLPNLEEDPTQEPDLGFVLGMTYDPLGDAARGSLWLVEVERDRIYEINLQGDIISSFRHPYVAVEPPPEGTPFGVYTSGVSLVAGGSPDELFLTGGALRDFRQVHILRVNKRSGLVVPGSAIPTSGIAKASTNGLLTIESTAGDAAPALLVLPLAGSSSKLLVVEHELIAPAAPTFLTAAQDGHDDVVRLRFTLNGPYDRIEVYRDCVRLAEISGSATEYSDPSAPAGIREYGVRGLRGGAASDFARATLRVGLGAILARAFTWPARSPQQLTRDPADDSLAVVVNWPGDERKVFHFDSSFRYLFTRESVVSPEWQIATMAIRAPAGGEKQLAYITWQLPVPIGDVASQRFLLIEESFSGQALAAIEIFPPRPTNGFITYPTALIWHPPSDSFYFLERNSKTFVQMTPSGATLRTFPHPSPPFQNFVFNTGMSFVPDRGTLLIMGSTRHDQRVTRAMEMTLDGALTGAEIAFDGLPFTVTAIAVQGADLVVVGGSSLPEILRLEAWAAPQRTFVRGDSDGSSKVNLTDAITTLSHLFRGGPRPFCEDAADADDNGIINVTDALSTLLTLFQGAGPLPPPYPGSGLDPTPDELTCS